MPIKKSRLILESVEGTGLRFRAETDNGFKFPIDSGTGAVAAGPVDLLIASLGACMGMDVIGILRKKRQEVTGYEIELVGDRRDTHPRSFIRIEVVHRVRGRDVRRAAVEEAVRLSETTYCSVSATLRPGVEITNRVEVLPA